MLIPAMKFERVDLHAGCNFQETILPDSYVKYQNMPSFMIFDSRAILLNLVWQYQPAQVRNMTRWPPRQLHTTRYSVIWSLQRELSLAVVEPTLYGESTVRLLSYS